MYPAIFSRTYPMRQVAEVVQAIQMDGFLGAHMNLSSFGMESLPQAVDETVLKIGQAAAERLGVKLVGLSGSYNMAHPDAEIRRSMRSGFGQVLKAAKMLAIPIVTLCTGSRDPENMWAYHPQNSSPEAWTDLRTELDWALAEAASLDLLLAIEPEPGNIIRDAKMARKLLNEVQAPHLKIILDAANLIGADGLSRQEEIVSEALELLGSEVVLAHAKDIDSSGKVVPPGRGAVDLPAFVKALAQTGFRGALIGHGFETRDTAQAGQMLRALCAEYT